MNLFFESAQTVRMQHKSEETSFTYFYNKALRKGIESYLGSFFVTENYDRLNFSPTWRGNPHEAKFTRKK